MTLLLSTGSIAFVSALLPLFNIEAFLAVASARGSASGPVLAAVAAAGQLAGKYLWYLAGAQSHRVAFIARRLQRPKPRARLERWQRRTAGRPVVTAAVLLVSATVGLPPFAVMAAVAGVLRVRLWLFLLTGFVGRFLRFWCILGAADAAVGLW